jgi:hypothetical protein
LLTLLL